MITDSHKGRIEVQRALSTRIWASQAEAGAEACVLTVMATSAPVCAAYELLECSLTFILRIGMVE